MPFHGRDWPLTGHLNQACEFSHDSTREGTILFVSAFFTNTDPGMHSVMENSGRWSQVSLSGCLFL
ncbi:MAG TPA: hypothetical protein DCR17_07250 [Verrucomicrobiales bacterium]|nr:hypothetical protein [Verrucomicrobiales bacterium]HCP37467.1 hypothetical protein [Verrucomicrobiales bacterium]